MRRGQVLEQVRCDNEDDRQAVLHYLPDATICPIMRLLHSDLLRPLDVFLLPKENSSRYGPDISMSLAGRWPDITRTRTGPRADQAFRSRP